MTHQPSEVLAAAYGALAKVAESVDEEGSWEPTLCVGWSVRDLLAHCLADAQRGLVALHTPVEGEPDRTSVTYWQEFGSSEAGSANGRRFTRVFASMFLDFAQLRDLYLETAAAVVTAADGTDGARLVGTQGHRLIAADLMVTLAVEATIHHLDLVAHRSGGGPPSTQGLAATRATLDGLLGHPSTVLWDDARYALVATGREQATAAEEAALGADRSRLPLLS